MKILCLLVLLANIFLLTWEYRSGALTTHKESPEEQALKGKEQILLIRELKKETHSSLPNINQATQTDVLKPDSRIIEIQGNIEQTYITTKQAEHPKVKLYQFQ
ncbi:hypothetical protein [Methyloglobulus sp.]|uniref:hypothetical protein n=1 Tax=Methyloglobulus sp. TaxID=2518622 RepID=UPI0032B7B7C0